MRQSQTGPADSRVSLATELSNIPLGNSNLTRGTLAPGQDLSTRLRALERSHPFGNQVSPVPAILQRVPVRRARSSEESPAMPAKEGMSTIADHVDVPERRSIREGRMQREASASSLRPEDCTSRPVNRPAVPLPAPFSLSATKRRVSLSHSRVLCTRSRPETSR